MPRFLSLTKTIACAVICVGSSVSSGTAEEIKGCPFDIGPWKRRGWALGIIAAVSRKGIRKQYSKLEKSVHVVSYLPQFRKSRLAQDHFSFCVGSSLIHQFFGHSPPAHRVEYPPVGKNQFATLTSSLPTFLPSNS
jgi:hypothetical protein